MKHMKLTAALALTLVTSAMHAITDAEKEITKTVITELAATQNITPEELIDRANSNLGIQGQLIDAIVGQAEKVGQDISPIAASTIVSQLSTQSLEDIFQS